MNRTTQDVKDTVATSLDLRSNSVWNHVANDTKQRRWAWRDRLTPLWGEPTPQDWCQKPVLVVRVGQPEPRWHRCRRTGDCSYCIRQRLVPLRALLDSDPADAMLTLTGASTLFPATKHRIKELMRTARRRSPGLTGMWTVEVNSTDRPALEASGPDESSAETGAHVHLLLRGSDLDEAAWSVLAQRSGFGSVVHLDASPAGGKALAYLVKTATWNETSLAAHLLLNGGRHFHQSRGFLRDPQTHAPLTLPQAIVMGSRRPAATAYRRSPGRRMSIGSALPVGQALSIQRRNQSHAKAVVDQLTGEVVMHLRHLMAKPVGRGVAAPVLLLPRDGGYLLLSPGQRRRVTVVPDYSQISNGGLLSDDG